MEQDQISQLRLVKDQIIAFLHWMEDSPESSQILRSAEFTKLAWDIHVRSLDWVNKSHDRYLTMANEAIEESMSES